MSVLVTDTGFAAVPPADFVTLAEIAAHKGAVDLAHTDTPEALVPYLADLTLIRVAFPSFSDGRAFTIARRLRALGYTGTLRANGPVIADQYAICLLYTSIRRMRFHTGVLEEPTLRAISSSD